VAARAGVSKPTIYRRWSGKTDLAVAAIVEACRPEGPPASGRPLHDIVELLSFFRAHFESNIQLPTLGSLLQESNQTPDLLTAFRDSAIRRFRTHFVELVEGARREGLMRDDGSVAVTVEMLIGAYYARAIVGDSFSDRWPQDLLNGSGLLTDKGRQTLEAMVSQMPPIAVRRR
jgi:AcrR family transcriptional regulator